MRLAGTLICAGLLACSGASSTGTDATSERHAGVAAEPDLAMPSVDFPVAGTASAGQPCNSDESCSGLGLLAICLGPEAGFRDGFCTQPCGDLQCNIAERCVDEYLF